MRIQCHGRCRPEARALSESHRLTSARLHANLCNIRHEDRAASGVDPPAPARARSGWQRGCITPFHRGNPPRLLRFSGVAVIRERLTMTGSGEIPEEGPAEAVLPGGTRLGKYEIVRLLGAGGMGAVYEASHTEIGKRVAVKVLGHTIAAVPGARVRFLREAQLTSKVRRPNSVDVTDMGNEGGQAFLVMEFLQGQDLAQRLAVAQKMGPTELVDIMLPVCSAVAAAPAAGIIFRDLKLQNIFL